MSAYATAISELSHERLLEECLRQYDRVERLEAKLRTLSELCDAHHQECIDTDGNDCTTDRKCPRQDSCWVTWVRAALAAKEEPSDG